MGLNVASGLDWGNRTPDKFIDYIVESAGVIRDFTIIDGVKSKVQVPIYTAGLVFHNDLCNFDPQSTAGIDEKEFTVNTYKWDFQNCKSILETEYRSKLLRKGQLNPETMDAEYADWLYERFGKLAANKLLTLSSSEIATAIDSGADAADVNKFTLTGALTSGTILANMEDAYEAMTTDMLSAAYGDADRELKPVFYLGTAAYQAYQIAVAAQTNSYDIQRQIGGAIPTYFGMEVRHYPSFAANRILVTAPANLVFVTDEMNDNQAIQNMYEPRTNSLDVWGQFKAAFDFLKGQEMVSGTL